LRDLGLEAKGFGVARHFECSTQVKL
jgi:hypothetical protein